MASRDPFSDQVYVRYAGDSNSGNTCPLKILRDLRIFPEHLIPKDLEVESMSPSQAIPLSCTKEQMDALLKVLTDTEETSRWEVLKPLFSPEESTLAPGQMEMAEEKASAEAEEKAPAEGEFSPSYRDLLVDRYGQPNLSEKQALSWVAYMTGPAFKGAYFNVRGEGQLWVDPSHLTVTRRTDPWYYSWLFYAHFPCVTECCIPRLSIEVKCKGRTDEVEKVIQATMTVDDNDPTCCCCLGDPDYYLTVDQKAELLKLYGREEGYLKVARDLAQEMWELYHGTEE